MLFPADACVYVPTGGAIPKGADCAVMIEYTEDYGDGTVGIMKPGAPGMNLIFRGDDVFPGKEILPAGRVLTAQDIGALAAGARSGAGCQRPASGGVAGGYGAEGVDYGIVVDDEELLRRKTKAAAESATR